MIESLSLIIQRAVPMVYDDSLSFLELLGKVVAKVNELIAADNAYFSVDLVTNLKKTLTEWQADGRLDTIITDALNTELDDYKIVQGAINDGHTASLVDIGSSISDINTLDTINSGKITALENTAVATSLKLTNQTIFNVKDYGATGNGITDDTVSIQSAINAAHVAGNSLVFFPSGNYIISTALTLYANLSMQGSSRETSSICPSTTGQTVFNLFSDTLIRAYCSISKIAIRAKALDVVGVSTSHVSACTFNDLLFVGCHSNFIIDRGTNHLIENILVEGSISPSIPAGNAIFYSSDSSDYLYALTVKNYQIRNIGNGVYSPAITLSRCVGASLSNVDVNDLTAGWNSADGILITNDCQGIRISDCLIVKPQTFGIKIDTAGGHNPLAIELINIHVDQSSTHGIWITAGSLINILGGVITSCGSNGISVGICTGLLIQGVNVATGTNNGISIAVNCTDFRLINNRIAGYNTGIAVAAGLGDRFIITQNDLITGNTYKLVNNATGTNIVVVNNLV